MHQWASDPNETRSKKKGSCMIYEMADVDRGYVGNSCEKFRGLFKAKEPRPELKLTQN